MCIRDRGEVEIRCREAAQFIPNETRQVLATGETDFERILPGPDRMYPDTDSPPYPIDRAHVESIRSRLPERPWDTEARLRGLGLSEHLVQGMIDSPYLELFDDLAARGKFPVSHTAHVLVDLLVHIRRIAGGSEPSQDELRRLFSLYDAERFSREGLRMLLEARARRGNDDWESLIGQLGWGVTDSSEYADATHKVCANHIHNGPTDPEAKFRYLMGEIMSKFRGKVSGTEIARLCRSAVREALAEDRKEMHSSRPSNE